MSTTNELELPDAITFTVTQEDIKRAQPGRASYCPVALALRRTLNTNEYIGVSLSYIRIAYDVRCESKYEIDEKLITFIQQFDAGIKPIPGSENDPLIFTITKCNPQPN